MNAITRFPLRSELQETPELRISEWELGELTTTSAFHRDAMNDESPLMKLEIEDLNQILAE